MKKLTAKMHHLIDLLSIGCGVLSSFVHRHGCSQSQSQFQTEATVLVLHTQTP